MDNKVPVTVSDIKHTIMNIQNSTDKDKATISVFTQDGFKVPYCRELFMTSQIGEKALEDWISSIVGNNNKFLFMIYRSQLWNSDLANKLKPFIANTLAGQDLSQYRFDITIMIGYYDFTPFGIHIDKNIERIFHFNVGEIKKKIYYWDNEPSDNCKFNPSNLIENSEVSIIEPFSIYELNPKKFHIGTSQYGCSYDIVLAVIKNE